MAGTVLGFMKFVLAFDTIAFKKGMTAAEKDLVRLQKKFEKFGKGMADLGKSMSLSVSGPLVAFAALGIKEARETEEAMAQVRAGLASMGNVAGKTATELQAFADEMEMHSLYEADEILRGVTATLLTFGNISGPMFDRAQQAVVDLATRLKTDLQSAAILVGKALNDPVKEVTALSRAGVQFDPASRAYIKSLVAMGDVTKAQTIIMQELEREFRNSAQAAQDADPYNQLADAVRGLSEELGRGLLPYLKTGAQDATTLAGKFRKLDDDTKGWLLTIGLIVALTGPFLYLLGNIIKIAAGFKLLVLFGAGLSAIGVGETAAATGAYRLGAGLRFLLGPIGWAIVAFEVLHHTLEAFPKLKAAVVGTIKAVADTIGSDLLNAIYNVMPELRLIVMALNAIGKSSAAADMIADTAGAAKRLGEEFAAFDKDKAFAAKLDAALIPPIQKTGKKAKDEFKKLADDIRQIMDRLFPEEAAARQYEMELALLHNEAALRKMKIGADQAAEAIARLNAEQAKAAADKATEAREKLLGPLKPILQRLFPEEARTAEFNKELETVTKNMVALGAGEASVAEATKRLQDEFAAEPLKKAAEAIGPIMDRLFPKTARANQFATELAAIESNMQKLGYTAEQIQSVVKDLTDEYVTETKGSTAQVIEAYGQMAVGVIDSTKRISETLKSGDLLGTLQHFLELVLNVLRTLSQLGVIGGGGGTAPTAPAAPPGRARGGPVRGGSAYVVGEKGPEIFTPRRGGYVHPNAAMGQARVMVVPSAYFDVVVDRRAANVAAPIAGQAAIMGMVGGEMRQHRLNRRNLP